VSNSCNPMDMSEPRSSWSVSANPRNPGHYYACCGMLEIASCLSMQALGWWRGNSFHFLGEPSLKDILHAFAGAEIIPQPSEMTEPEDGGEVGTKRVPIILKVAGSRLFIEWYRDTSIKGWTGNQDIVKILTAMRGMIDPECPEPLLAREASDIIPPGFDSTRVASAPLTCGFSADAVGLRSSVCPAAESLPLIGLQRWRPQKDEASDMLTYSTWTDHLDVNSASVVGTGRMRLAGAKKFLWQPVAKSTRDHKIFGPANLSAEEVCA